MYLSRGGERARGERDRVVGQATGVDHMPRGRGDIRSVDTGELRAREVMRERRWARGREETRVRRVGSGTGGTNGTENRNGLENGDFGRFHDGGADVDGDDDITDDELSTLRHRRS